FTVTFFEDLDGDGLLDTFTDNVLGSATQQGIDGNTTLSIEAEVSGTLQFAGNLTYAFADSSDVLVESDETNNIGSSAPPCEAQGPVEPFAPVLERAWTAG